MADDASKPKKKGGKLKKILILTIAVAGLVGGGVAGGMYAAGAGLVGGAHAAVEDPNRPKLVPRGGEHGEEAPAPAPEGHGAAAADSAPVDPRKYQATYYPLEQSFTANLADTDGFLQVGIGVSTYYDERVVENIKKDEMPIRSAVLLALAEQSAENLSTPEGKTQLQRKLKDAINQTLRQKEGFGGIDSVYFTSFIVQ